MPAPVQPTLFQTLRRAEALGIDIKLQADTKTGKLMWDNSHNGSDGALAVRRATNRASACT